MDDDSTRNLRAVAHPTRLRLLGLLRANGPATGAMLADVVHEAAGTISYHLRTLADVGYIVRTEPRSGDRRTQWWEAAERLTSWGLGHVHEEPWGPFGRGWTNEHFAAEVVAPTVSPLIAYPRPWTPGTNGVVTADVVLAVVNSEADLAKFRGTLAGKIVLALDPVDIPLQARTPRLRFSDADLQALQTEPVRAGRGRGMTGSVTFL